jgi:hypothetical protein
MKRQQENYPGIIPGQHSVRRSGGKNGRRRGTGKERKRRERGRQIHRRNRLHCGKDHRNRSRGRHLSYVDTEVGRNAKRTIRMVGCPIRVHMRYLHRSGNHQQQNAQQRKENAPCLCCTRCLAVPAHMSQLYRKRQHPGSTAVCCKPTGRLRPETSEDQYSEHPPGGPCPPPRQLH